MQNLCHKYVRWAAGYKVPCREPLPVTIDLRSNVLFVVGVFAVKILMKALDIPEINSPFTSFVSHMSLDNHQPP